MNEQYLWDRSGPPDPDVEALERTLGPLRYRHRADLLQPRRPPARTWWAAAAAALLVSFSVWQFRQPPAVHTGWQVAGVEGTAHLGGRSAAVSMQVKAGQVIRTGRESELTLEAGELGRLELFPNSEMRASSTRQVALKRGKLHAFIWAPPRQFVVETPSARAVDMGCEYTISVDDAGDGLLVVSMGWVAFQHGRYEAFIPAGAACRTRKREGPGIPYYYDAGETLKAAITRYERGDQAALGDILRSAGPRDGLTLWHLLTRAPEAERGRVFDRFAELEGVPAGVSREGVVRLDAAMVDLCWNALDLENTDWWRGWKRNWK